MKFANLLVAAALVAVLAVVLAPARALAAEDEFTNPELDAVWNDITIVRAAQNAPDAQTLAALAWMIEGADARTTILDRLVRTSPNAIGIACAIATEQTGAIDPKWLDRWLAAEPDNAAPYYLKAFYLFSSQAGEPDEALGTFEKGAAASGFNNYWQAVRQALPKAFDALRLSGRLRLCAWHRAFERSVSDAHGSIGMAYTSLARAVWQESSDLPHPRQVELAEGLIKLSGNAMTMASPWNSQTKSVAFSARASAEDDPVKKRTYQSAAAALASDTSQASTEWQQRFYLALTFGLYGDQLGPKLTAALGPKATDEIRARVKAVLDKMSAAGQALVTAVSADMDGIMDDMLLGGPLALPDAFAQAYPEANAQIAAANALMDDLQKILKEVPTPIGSRRALKELGLAIGMYQADHDEAIPETLQVLVDQGYLRKQEALVSPLSGKPFVYTPTGIDVKHERTPAMVMLAYDDIDIGEGQRNVLFYDLHVAAASAADFEEMLKKQGVK